MSIVPALKDRLSRWVAALDPKRARARQFAFLDKPSQKDLDNKKIEPELLLLHFFLDPAKAFFDVGANAGEYEHVALRHMPAKNIYAFEPQATLAKRLHAIFPDVHVERLAFSDGTGTARLKVPVISGALYRARGTLEQFVETGESDARYEEVPMRTLDSVSRDIAVPVGCIKIDVEGHERSVVEGSLETLRRDSPNLIVEIEQRHHQEPIGEIFRFITNNGYDGYFFDTSARSFVEISKFDVSARQRMEDFKTMRYVNNFVFVPAGSALPPGPVRLI